MLVLTVAVLVREDLGGGVGLVAADAEGDADVADVGGDVVIERAGFGLVGGHARGEFGGLGLYRVVGDDAVGLEHAVPLAHLFPGFEGGPGDGGQLALFEVELLIGGPENLLLRGGFGFGFLADRGLQLGVAPEVDVLPRGIGGSGGGGFDRLNAGTPDVDVHAGGDTQLGGLGEDDGGSAEYLLAPALSGN